MGTKDRSNLSIKGQYNIIDIDDVNTLSYILMNEYVLHTIEAGMLLLLVMIGVIKMIKKEGVDQGWTGENGGQTGPFNR